MKGSFLFCLCSVALRFLKSILLVGSLDLPTETLTCIVREITESSARIISIVMFFRRHFTEITLAKFVYYYIYPKGLQ